MVEAALREGSADRRSVFELFGRRLPPGRRYGVVAGIGRILKGLPEFRFTDDQIDYLHRTGVVNDVTAAWLAGFTFTGHIWGYAEGEVFFPSSPLLIVEGTFAEAVLLETWLLSILNHDCSIAAAAARITIAAGDRPCIEMGSRRTHEEAAVAAARAAYVAGFESTSNLEAGMRHGIPTRGTAAHSFTLLHDTEAEAFAAQVASLGTGTTLLIDTYDVDQGVRTAIEVAGPGLGAVRIDSGDLATESRRIRALLDGLGATGTRIVATSDLDEYECQRLADSPIDGYGVGTQLVTGSGAPTAGLVYKLVARAEESGPDAQLIPVQKRSESKGSVGGRKEAYRRLSPDGVAEAEVVMANPGPDDRPDPATHRPLLVPLVRDGTPIAHDDLAAARQRLRDSLAELPPTALRLEDGGPAIPTEQA